MPLGNIINTYRLDEIKNDDYLTFSFISRGDRDVIKKIEYIYVQLLNEKKVYNLGFGDYEIASDQIIDTVNTQNGDHYQVFNTVLSTIPIFFSHFPDSFLAVNGSDSESNYIANCKLSCTKKCNQNKCKNADRRINIYRNYIDKNYEELIKSYRFLGANPNNEGPADVELYQRYKKYNSVLLFTFMN
jgi:hypothetical protein